VSGVADVPPEIVAAQIRSVASDIGVDAAKTGMLSSAGIVEAVAGVIEEAGIANLVADPVFVSKHGHPLLRPDAVDALRRRILPLATIVTPNLPRGRRPGWLRRADSRRHAGVPRKRSLPWGRGRSW